LASNSLTKAALAPERCSAEVWEVAIAPSDGNAWPSESNGAAGGGAASNSPPATVILGSELVPPRVEGAAFPWFPDAAGVIAIAHYRRRG